jgi:hypothetical protein
MNEIGCLVLGLGCGGALGYALHSLVWWLRDQRALARWDAEGPREEIAAIYVSGDSGLRPRSWAERIAQLTEEHEQ